MIIQNLTLANESYTYENWIQKDVFVSFSRLYYIIDGEAYYEEGGRKVRLKKGYLYLTPVKRCFTLTENPNDKLLHTFCHITTVPAVEELIGIRVEEDTPLSDAVSLLRKYIHSRDTELLMNVIQFVLSCVDKRDECTNGVAQRIKNYIDRSEGFELDMDGLSKKMGYSREHITRSFISAYRTTPKKYFNQRKMNIALKKLSDGVRVNEVAYQLNYSSSYSFSKAFKKYFGLSPQKYMIAFNREDQPPLK